MSNNDYYDEFIKDDELPSVREGRDFLPSWVSEKNSSHNAYKAILALKKDKLTFIKKHSLKSQYIKKSNYRMQKSEVARLTNKKAQPLFNSNAYSEGLTNFFDHINAQLEEAKEQRINRPRRGLRNKRKEDLVNEHKALLKTHQTNLSQIVGELYQKVMDRMPLDVKRKLKLK
jgi:hypothetical protein